MMGRARSSTLVLPRQKVLSAGRLKRVDFSLEKYLPEGGLLNTAPLKPERGV
jgi:hypothetical protein